MKKAWAMGSVVALQGVMIGALMLAGGCGTTGQTPTPPPAESVPMPPTIEPPPPVEPPAMKVLPPPTVDAGKKYTVKAGDSLSMIAKRFNVSKADIMKLNKITNPDKIRVGQKLMLPGYVNLDAPAPAHKAGTSKAPRATGGSYTVVSGDTLGGIAYRHGTTVAALKQVNSMTSDKIHIGQKLALPKGAVAKAPVKKAPASPAVVDETVAPVDTVGVAPVAPDALPDAPKANEVLHVVEPNQDLSSIAMMYGVRAEEILRLNNLVSPDVKVGQTLKIPPPVE